MARHGLFLVPFALSLLAPLAAQDPKVEWWTKDFDGALAASGDSAAKMLLLYFWRDPDDTCKAMFGGTLSDPKVVPVLAGFCCMGAQDGTDIGKPLFAKYGIERAPTVLFLTADGAVVDAIAGYVPVADFLTEIERVKAGKDTVAALREAATKKPDDLELQLELINKLRATGDKQGSTALIEAVIAKDPKQKNEFAAEAMLIKINDEVFKPDIAPQDYDLEPLRAFLAQQKNKRVRFLGYDRMAAAEYRRENLKEAAKHVERAWKDIPKEDVLVWGQNIASLAYRHYKELDKIDKGLLKTALKISEKALEEVEAQHKTTPDNPFYANALYLHAAVLNINNKRKEAFAMMDRAIEIDPKNENLKEAKKRWVDGEK